MANKKFDLSQYNFSAFQEPRTEKDPVTPDVGVSPTKTFGQEDKKKTSEKPGKIDISQYDFSAFVDQKKPEAPRTAEDVRLRAKAEAELRRAEIGKQQLSAQEQEAAEEAKTDPEINRLRQLQALFTGIGRTATIEFADEMSGAIGALYPGVTYEEARDRARKGHQELEEEFPMTTLTGQIVGGLTPTGAVGAAGRALKLMPTSHLNKIGKNSKGLWNKTKAGAGAGALAGAGFAVGMTEQDLTTPSGRAAALAEVTGYTAIGTASGMILPPALAGVGAGIRHMPGSMATAATAGAGGVLGAAVAEDPVEGFKKGLAIGAVPGAAGTLSVSAVSRGLGAARGIKDKAFPFLGIIIDAFDQGYMGNRLTGRQAFGKIADDIYGFSRERVDELFEYGNQLASLQRQILKEADVAVDLRALSRLLGDPDLPPERVWGSGDRVDVRKVVRQIDDWKKLNPDFVYKPDEAWHVHKVFSNLMDQGELKSSLGSLLGVRARDLSREKVLEAVPALREHNLKIRAIHDLADTLGLGRTQDAVMDAAAISKMTHSIADLVASADKNNMKKREALKNLIKILEESDHHTGHRKAEELVGMMRSLGLRHKLNAFATQDGNMTGALMSITAKMSGVSNALGLGARTASEQMSGMTNWFSQATPEQLKTIGRYYKDTATSAGNRLGDIFDRMAVEDPRGRQALVYTLLQNSGYRKALGIGAAYENQIDLGKESNPVMKDVFESMSIITREAPDAYRNLSDELREGTK